MTITVQQLIQQLQAHPDSLVIAIRDIDNDQDYAVADITADVNVLNILIEEQPEEDEDEK